MKKEENSGRQGPALKEGKTSHDYRSRSHSPKAYLGCDTCKLKNSELLKKNKSVSKFSDYNCNLDKNKVNKLKGKASVTSEKEDMKKGKIKLTDLCDDDKKRIVELIEELSKFADKNQKYKEMLDRMQKTRQDQQDYIMKQANLHLEEKNFYVNEINEYKSKVEALENDLKNKTHQWEKQERAMSSEISYLSKAVQDSIIEKNDLNEQLNHLKICLRQSLESFQRLREDITILQHQDKFMKKFKSATCQTETKFLTVRDVKFNCDDLEIDEDFFSLSNHNSMEGKSSLDVINDKLEHVYQLLKRKSETFKKHNPQKLDIDLSILLRNDQLSDTLLNNNNSNSNKGQDDLLKEVEQGSAETGYKFLKPYDYSDKKSFEAEKILKKIGKPLAAPRDKKTPNGSSRISPTAETDKSSKKNTTGTESGCSGKPKSLQSIKMLRSEETVQQCNEDRLLEDLFYTDGNLKLGLVEPILDENSGKIPKKLCHPG